MVKEFDWTIQNNKDFESALNRLGKETSDFRVPFKLIASDFYLSQKQIFNLKSEGLYPPLGGFNHGYVTDDGRTRREKAEDDKELKTGHNWFPILYGMTGNLRDSTLSKNHRYSIFNMGRKYLEIGTSVPYGKYHQSDQPRKKIPYRKFVFITGGLGDRSKDSGIFGRRERWISIIDDHVTQLVSGEILK